MQRSHFVFVILGGSACLLVTAAAMSQHMTVEWKQFQAASDANSALKLDGKVPCRVASSTRWYVGQLDGTSCKYRDASDTAQSKPVQQFEYLKGPTVSFEKAMVSASSNRVPWASATVFRGSGSPTQFVCYSQGDLGWITGDKCRTRSTTSSTFSTFVLHPTADTAGVYDNGTFWKDVTNGGISGWHTSWKFCRVKTGGSNVPRGGMWTGTDASTIKCKTIEGDGSGGFKWVEHTPSETTKVEGLIEFSSSVIEAPNLVPLPASAYATSNAYLPANALLIGKDPVGNKTLRACRTTTVGSYGLWVDRSCRYGNGANTTSGGMMLVMWAKPS